MRYTRPQLYQHLASIGGTWEDDGTGIECYPPDGMVWIANGLDYLRIDYRNLYGPSWLGEALAEALPQLRLGISVKVAE